MAPSKLLLKALLVPSAAFEPIVQVPAQQGAYANFTPKESCFPILWTPEHEL